MGLSQKWNCTQLYKCAITFQHSGGWIIDKITGRHFKLKNKYFLPPPIHSFTFFSPYNLLQQERSGYFMFVSYGITPFHRAWWNLTLLFIRKVFRKHSPYYDMSYTCDNVHSSLWEWEQWMRTCKTNIASPRLMKEKVKLNWFV